MPDAHPAAAPSKQGAPTMVGTLAQVLGVASPVLGGLALAYALFSMVGSCCCGLLPLLGLGLSILAGLTSVSGLGLSHLASEDERLAPEQRQAALSSRSASALGLALSLLASAIQCVPFGLVMLFRVGSAYMHGF